MSALYKVTGTGGTACHGGSGRWVKNRWRSVKGDLIPCARGLHLCRREDLVRWLGPVIWRAEYDGELIEHDNKVVVRRARVIERYDTWNERTARLFAADCAERVLPIFEKEYPNDDRPRKAIEAARACARGEIGAEEMAAAEAAAQDAWTAARSAGCTCAAARDARAAALAAGAAAWAAEAAARDAWDAAGAAAEAAEAAAWDAAGDAWDAARADFRAWATGRLFDYLEGRAA